MNNKSLKDIILSAIASRILKTRCYVDKTKDNSIVTHLKSSIIIKDEEFSAAFNLDFKSPTGENGWHTMQDMRNANLDDKILIKFTILKIMQDLLCNHEFIEKSKSFSEQIFSVLYSSDALKSTIETFNQLKSDNNTLQKIREKHLMQLSATTYHLFKVEDLFKKDKDGKQISSELSKDLELQTFIREIGKKISTYLINERNQQKEIIQRSML